MTARILVVDDVQTNVKLLEARLMAEYFQVLTATNGEDALALCESGQCDMVLLDVMMPGMDGFEVCKRLKNNPETMHLPVVMVTALDQPEDRIRGLEAGADDFLTKPVNDLALVTRVKSLVRLKMLTDDLRLRAANGDEFAMNYSNVMEDVEKPRERTNILVVDDRAASYEKMVATLSVANNVEVETNPNDALFRVVEGQYDLAIISLSMNNFDSLRLCSHLRSLERTRLLPLIVISTSGQEEVVSRALEIGVNDYIKRPIDTQELLARVKTQLCRKRYNDCLRASVQQTIEMAVKDPLTNLHNRRYFEMHFASLFEKSVASNKPITAMMCDIDKFKAVNDTHGHDVGDAVIAEVANRIRKNVRNVDIACRYGGEEFVIIMPDTDIAYAHFVAERIRREVEEHPVIAGNGSKQIYTTISMGLSCIEPLSDTPQDLMKRADTALYAAKRAGRNQIVTQAA